MIFSRITAKSTPLQHRTIHFSRIHGLFLCALLFALAFIFPPQSAQAACTNPANPAGVIRYDSAEHMMTYCDGTDWIRMGKDVVATPATLTPHHLVFITSTSYTGDLLSAATGLGYGGSDGIEAADYICQNAADTESISGTFKAWISKDDPATDPESRFVQGTNPYKDLLGRKIDDDWTDLVAGTIIDNIIKITEKGTVRKVNTIRTNTLNTGITAASGDCSGWTSTTGSSDKGYPLEKGKWSNGSFTVNCSTAYPLYCFQQDTTSPPVQCANPPALEGEIHYNDTLHVMQFCNGEKWIAMGPPVGNMIAFVTSTSVSGNMGGLTGGDAHCQSLADSAGLSGTYMAWLSDATGSPSTRFYQSTYPYRRVDGALIANNWTDLTDGSIQNYMNVTETAGPHPGGTWLRHTTNTNTNGILYDDTKDCSEWSSTSGNVWHGEGESTNSGWTTAGGNSSCGSHYLLCFQQSTTYPTGDPWGSGCINPTGTEGELYFNTTYNTMQYCNGYDWIGIRGFNCDDDMVLGPFTDQPAVTLSSTINSDIIQLNDIACETGIDVTISGDGTPKYRICTDGSSSANCDASETQTWTTGTSVTLKNGEYLQLRTTTSASYSTTNNVTVNVGSKSDTWTVTTKPPPKIVFVTSTNTYKGNAFSTPDPDPTVNAASICQTHADNATPPLSGTFKAWLASTSANDPESTHNQHLGEYHLVSGTKVADNWSDLTDGSLDSGFNEDENGTALANPSYFWTGTTSSGLSTTPNCNGWTSGGGGANGQRGQAYDTGVWWPNGIVSCNNSGGLLCIEQ